MPLLIHYRDVPEAVTEQDSGGIVEVHLGVDANGAPFYDVTNELIGLVGVAEQLLCGYESDEMALLVTGRPCEFGGDQFLGGLRNGVFSRDRTTS